MEVYNNKRTPIARWIVAAVLLLCFGGFIFLAYSGYAAYFDDPVRNFIYGLRADWLTVFFNAVTFMAEPMTLIVLCGIMIIFPLSTLRFGIPIGVVTGLGALAHKGLKLLIMRERPDVVMHLVEETGYSFPSGHANAGLIFYIFLAFLISRVLKSRRQEDLAHLITVLLVILVFLIGISRIYLGVHYPTDILAGWCLGGILLIIFVTLYDAIYPLKYHLGPETPEWASPDKKQWVRKKRPEPTKAFKQKAPDEVRWVRREIPGRKKASNKQEESQNKSDD